MWGKYLAEELPAVYGEQAGAVMVFVSAEYAVGTGSGTNAAPPWPGAVRERREYVPRDADAAGHSMRNRVAAAAPRDGFGIRPAR